MRIKSNLCLFGSLSLVIFLMCGVANATRIKHNHHTVSADSTQAAKINESSCGKPKLLPGNWHDMFYHDGLKKIMLVNGGPEQGKSSSDPLELWEWNGTCWVLLNTAPNAPRWRNFASIAFDSKRKVLVLYGGLQSPSVQFEETWEWDGKNWKRHDAKGPGHREASGMTYDAKRNQVVLFGGAQGDKSMGDTWAWDGKNWTLISETGPASRFPAGFVYDSTREVVMLFGGHRFTQNGVETFGDTWTWNGKNWKQLTTTNAPAPRDGARAVFDSLQKQVVMFGGVEIGASVKFFNDTWLWNGTTWTEIKTVAPLGRAHPVMAYDSSRNRIIVFGGSRKMGEILTDTWEWDGRLWKCIDGCSVQSAN